MLMTALQSVANLLGCEAEQLQIALSTRNLTVGSENIVQKLTLAQVTRINRYK